MAVKRLRLRRGTAEQWTEANPVLRLGEQGYETDTVQLVGNICYHQFKIGDGTTAWNDLPYAGWGNPVSSGGGGTVAWADVTGKPTTFAPSAHTHPWSEVTGKPTEFAPVAHTHDIGEVNGLQDSLDAKADLQDGVLLTSQLPALAISEFLGEVNSVGAMRVLTAQQGDWCIRTDESQVYVYIGAEPSTPESPSDPADWRYIEYPGAPVSSVNGQTGAVVLGKSDVGLSNVDNTSDANKPVSAAQAAALAGKANTSHTHNASDISDFGSAVKLTELKDFVAGPNAVINPASDSLLIALQKLQAQITAKKSYFNLSVYTQVLIQFPAASVRWYAVNGAQANATVTDSNMVARKFNKGGLVSNFGGRFNLAQPASGNMVFEVFAGADPASLSGTGLILTVAAGTSGLRSLTSASTYVLPDGHYMAVKVTTNHTSGNSAQLIGYDLLLTTD